MIFLKCVGRDYCLYSRYVTYSFITSKYIVNFKDWCIVNVPTVGKKQKFLKNMEFFSHLKCHIKERVGSGSGSVIQWYESTDPDPYQTLRYGSWTLVHLYCCSQGSKRTYSFNHPRFNPFFLIPILKKSGSDRIRIGKTSAARCSWWSVSWMRGIPSATSTSPS